MVTYIRQIYRLIAFFSKHDASPQTMYNIVVWLADSKQEWCIMQVHIDRLEQERRNSSALAMVLCVSCAKSSTCWALIQYKDDILPV